MINLKEIEIFAPIIIGLNVLISYLGFKNNDFFEKYKFNIGEILQKKDFKRIIASGFLHVNWSHLFFNMFSLYIFSGLLEKNIGIPSLALIYFVSLIGGGLFSLIIHRNQSNYSAVGASGAVCGLIFASIALFPGLKLGIMFIPIPIPSWLFGLLYIAYSIYGVHSEKGNIGHDAHLGGALIGMITAIIMVPEVLLLNILPISLVIIPSILFIILILTYPQILKINKNL